MVTDEEKLKRLFIELYNSGYNAGHDDTVESCFTPVLDCDMDSYHGDIVEGILAGKMEITGQE